MGQRAIIARGMAQFTYLAKNEAPEIMTKFKDWPYSYELLPQYADGSKPLLAVKAINWEEKTTAAAVIRGLVKATPVAENETPKPREYF